MHVKYTVNWTEVIFHLALNSLISLLFVPRLSSPLPHVSPPLACTSQCPCSNKKQKGQQNTLLINSFICKQLWINLSHLSCRRSMPFVSSPQFFQLWETCLSQSPHFLTSLDFSFSLKCFEGSLWIVTHIFSCSLDFDTYDAIKISGLFSPSKSNRRGWCPTI